MVNNHLCIDSCFSARTSERYVITCFFCEKKFNSRCFDLSTSQKLFSTTNNAFFMCYKCIDRVVKLKQNVRRSNESAASSQRNDLTTTTPRNMQQTTNADVNMSLIVSMLTKMDEKLARLNTSNDEIIQRTSAPSLLDRNEINDVSTISHSIDNLRAKLDLNMKLQSEIDVRSKSTLEKLNDLHNTVTATTKPITTPGFNKLKKRTNGTTHSTLDPLNWSFSFSQSTLPHENADLYQLLHGFEQNTWASFDYLSQKMNETSNALMNVETICRELTSKSSSQVRSPVMDSIALDNLQVLNDKCDNIEKKT